MSNYESDAHQATRQTVHMVINPAALTLSTPATCQHDDIIIAWLCRLFSEFSQNWQSTNGCSVHMSSQSRCSMYADITMAPPRCSPHHTEGKARRPRPRYQFLYELKPESAIANFGIDNVCWSGCLESAAAAKILPDQIFFQYFRPDA